MLLGHKQKNKVAKYLLNYWIRYEKSINNLHPSDIENVKLFFAALQKISLEERLYLASQFRTARGKKYTDAEIAAIHGIDVAAHKEKRIACETALQNALIEIEGAKE